MFLDRISPDVMPISVRMTDALVIADVYARTMQRWFSLVIGCALLFGPQAAQATVVKAMTLEEKTAAAPLVVHAVVERVESDWEIEGARARTLITVRVIETLKGDAARDQRLILRQGGGHIGDFHQTAPGMSKFEEGEECVLFLEPLGAMLVELGIGIGKYGIEDRGRDKWVSFAPNVAAYRVIKGERGHVEEVAPMEPERLSTFLKRVRSFARNIPSPQITPRKGVTLKPAPVAEPR
jgi:hypothetical protein